MGYVDYARYLLRRSSVDRILMYMRQDGANFVLRSAYKPPKKP